MRTSKVFVIVIGWLFAAHAAAQLPYFAATVGDGKMYGYSSVKWRPGINSQETYTTFQYGVGDHWAAGIDLYTGPGTQPDAKQGNAYWGALVRYGQPICQWFNVGGEFIPTFNLNDNFHFAYLSSALYMNGAISKDNRLFWCSNTWWTVRDGAANSLTNNEYLGYTFPLKNRHSFSAMAGTIHSWKFDQDLDITAGCYYTINTWSLYVWGNDFLQSHPRFIVGIEFAL